MRTTLLAFCLVGANSSETKALQCPIHFDTQFKGARAMGLIILIILILLIFGGGGYYGYGAGWPSYGYGGIGLGGIILIILVIWLLSGRV
jgi:Protein of unknown function (DUF3309)